ncbi:quinolinate synthase NadA [Kurthia sibirica]|uniref:Quinolinate synthase n=1 Tax=Kurthia sibirica TaxID=202750 RepID=A0A2U3AIJ9_9BACL|nr:quinolinate synthase NadA [Kurthia sibirica]PWI24281.1 quinolinate synthase [Kurthia sibirica]GEK34484.1 quinolinate synthase A [Kurthia sibirica]
MSLLQGVHALPQEYRQLSVKEMTQRIWTIKEKSGAKLFIPGHHYQRDEVIQFADVTGDSLQLAQLCAANTEARHIVFCGVHFMAETADMLTTNDQHVYLPDMRAGCSMADMATIHQTEQAWISLQQLFGDTLLPLTYVNSTAAIKKFTGYHGGACLTSSNAKQMMQWALAKKQRLFFLPDQHLGRNTAFELGIPLHAMAIWDPLAKKLIYEGELDKIVIILWQGHCSVHEGFTLQNIATQRQEDHAINIIVHPECSHEVVQAADFSGSTKYIIDTIKNSAVGSAWAIGTEMNLVKRLIATYSDRKIVSLNATMCPCLTMNRIDLPHLLWQLESILADAGHNQITVDDATKKDAILSLDRMLATR